MGKSLITASAQWTGFDLRAVSQWMVLLRVVVEQQTNICPQVIIAQQIDSGLMAVLQQTVMPRVVIKRWTYLTPQATSTVDRLWFDGCVTMDGNAESFR